MSRGGRYNRLSGDARRNLTIDNAYVWDVAREIDYPNSDTGRPNRQPLWVFFLWMVLIHEYGSSRKVEEAFEDPAHGPWNQIRTAAKREFGGDRPELIPPAEPPTRNQFNYALKHHLPAHTETSLPKSGTVPTSWQLRSALEPISRLGRSHVPQPNGLPMATSQ